MQLVGDWVDRQLLSASASRQAHRLATRAGGEDPAARLLWFVVTAIFAVIVADALFSIFFAQGGI